MGVTFSLPFVNDLDDKLESVLVRSISFGSHNANDPQSVSFNGGDSKPARLKSFGSGKMILEGSLSFQGKELEAKISLQASPSNSEEHTMIRSFSFRSGNALDKLPAADNVSEKNVQTPLPESGSNRHLAALKLQKTYKSFRTRRQLADCAVLVEQRWWKLLDFAELKRSSISFFEIEKPETAVSRWSRARTRAAKVGKGLSKDEKARKLALQHWLEAIDPRHRYGHNLQFYYANWLQCDSKQPFFYWLDIGEGRDVNLERCPRSKLQQQCIKYLGPTERSAYEVVITNGKLVYKQSGKLLDTREGPEDVKWIFVLSVSKILYVGQKKKGTFQHSSFLAGGATLSAGRLVVEDGVLKAVWPHSGHYLPTEENFEAFMEFLSEHNVDLSVVQRAPCNGEEEVVFGLRNSISVPDLRSARKENNNKNNEEGEKTDSSKKYCIDAENIHPPVSRWSRKLHSKIALLQIPRRENMLELFSTPKPGPLESSPSDGYETADECLSDSEFSVSKQNLFNQDQEQEYEQPVPREKIMKRINSHKGMKSYQLAKQLSCKWTTGAGPRIGCVRDYPSELQFRVMEEVCLSPRSAFSSPRGSSRSPTTTATATPTSSLRERSLLGTKSEDVAHEIVIRL
ncbi:IQ domain-containing protein IQM6 [Sesamum alatum]|uniref:IQ domain-containing protein IQM6 n=1 Tax=Sesamum alatum TaxID=300844 RepID=A0AAE1XJJ8_9LAMI|nr:IQ domain-containing protein IQM6 [Sesamum alatum]